MSQKLLFALVVLSSLYFSCKKNTDLPVTQTTPADSTVHIKKRFLTGAFGSSDGVSFGYDSTGKLNLISSLFGKYYVYNKNDTIHHVIYSDYFDNEYWNSVAIFEYRSDKKISKVYYKVKGSFNSADAFLNDPYNNFYMDVDDGLVATLDSIVYSSSGQLAEIWQRDIAHNQVLITQKFVYEDLNKKSPVEIQYFYSNGMHSKDAWLSVDSTEDELYKTFWFLPFANQASLTLSLGGSSVSITPLETDGYRAYWALVPQYITYFQEKNYTNGVITDNYASPQFKYVYNADSTRLDGQLVNSYLGAPSFYYIFDKR